MKEERDRTKRGREREEKIMMDEKTLKGKEATHWSISGLKTIICYSWPSCCELYLFSFSFKKRGREKTWLEDRKLPRMSSFFLLFLSSKEEKIEEAIHEKSLSLSMIFSLRMKILKLPRTVYQVQLAGASVTAATAATTFVSFLFILKPMDVKRLGWWEKNLSLSPCFELWSARDTAFRRSQCSVTLMREREREKDRWAQAGHRVWREE